MNEKVTVVNEPEYKVSPDVQEIVQNTTLRPDRCGGWFALNIGTADAIVDGIPLQPGDSVDYTYLRPNVVWASPIQIILNTGAKIRLVRFRYSKM